MKWKLLKDLMLIIICIITIFGVLHETFYMMSIDSDISFYIGLFSTILTFVLIVLSVPKIFQIVKKDAKMYKGLFGIILAFIIFSGCTRIDPGHVGIKVELAGSQRGVQDFPLRTGWVFYNPISESVFEYPTYVQTAVWTRSAAEGKPINEEITFTTNDQMQVSADISLAYHIESSKVPAFYVKFRSDKLDTFTHGFLRNLAREKFDALAGKYKIEQIMGDNAQFLQDVRSELQKEVSHIGVVFDQFGFIGAPRPPQQVIDSINAKVQAVQKAIQTENELRQSEAEAKKVVAKAEGWAKARMVEAEAEAKSNQLVSQSISPILVQYKAIEKWDGKRPTVEGSNAGLLLQIPVK